MTQERVRNRLRNLTTLSHNLTARYVAALGTVALLALLGQLFIQSVVEQQAQYRDLVGVAVKLGAASQALSRSVAALQIQVGAGKVHYWNDAVSEAAHSFGGLLSDLERKLGATRLKPEESAITNSIPELRALAIGLLKDSRKLRETSKQESFGHLVLVRRILEQEQTFRGRLSTLASKLDASAAVSVERLKLIELGLTAILLLVLALQGVFVFRPAVARVNQTLMDLKASEVQLRQARAEAMLALKVRSEFVTNISHEIRNPLNAILGMGELLSDTALDSSQRRYVEILRRAGQSILDLVNDFLDFSRLEAGKIEIEQIQFSWLEIAERSLEIVSSRAVEKGIELVLDADLDLPEEVDGDPKRLQQILVNLLVNSVKFTPKGSVTLKITAPTRTASLFNFDFAVKDTGIGIPQDRLNRIFESFVQVDSSITRKFGGNGLGLSICKQLSDLMGGTIAVVSEEGQGSEFKLSLPLVPVRTTVVADRIRKQGLEGLKVAIVDFQADRASSLARLIRLQNSDAVLLKDSAVQDLDFSDADLVVADRSFGASYETLPAKAKAKKGAVWLCSLRELNRKPTIAGNNPESVFLPKPARLSHIIQALLELSQVSTQDSTPLVTPSPIGNTGTAGRILIVDDSEDNRLVFGTYLRNTQFEYDFAENGQLALDALYRGDKNYNLILMDIQMPVLDGFAATREIRKWERETGFPSTPIIALTAYSTQAEIQKCLDAGCSGHLRKPASKANFLTKIVDEISKTGSALAY